MWFFYKVSFENEHLDYFIESIKGFFLKTFEGYSFIEAINGEFFRNMSRTKLIREYFEEFYKNYNGLSQENKSIIQEAFRINTNIENVCLSILTPVKYSELPGLVREDLKNIFDYLYEDFPKIKYFKESLGSFKNYYDQFYEQNFSENTLCPFCGLKFMKTPEEKRREPFDHYLLRSQYPFVSLIRNNLVPMCHDCNEDYKKEYDISNRKVFYPFTDRESDVVLKINGSEVQVHSDHFTEEVESWDNIFDVKQRIEGYVRKNKSALLSNFTELESLFEEKEWKEYLERKIQSCDKYLYYMHNYIEKAILLDEFSYIFNTGEMTFESEGVSDSNFQQSNNEHDIMLGKCLIKNR
ncbi:hypothetical protein CN572_25860 [Bacillus wiedmannii]|nr:hypothetical protein [Bacillus wiedmannii]PEO68952.1 hypothetical protein CN572_25860 [Bacillus wiedmannii]